jgi:hypothetical protein
MAYNAGDPATWVLPIEAYLPTPEEDRQISKAREALVESCLRRYGFDPKPLPDLPSVGTRTLTDLRYGIHNPKNAESWGYKPDPERQAAYDAAVAEGVIGEHNDPDEPKVLQGDVSSYNGKPVPEGGCSAESDRRISGENSFYSKFAENLGNEAWIKAKREPDVTKVFQLWSACMKTEGHTYAEPMDAHEDPRFAETPASSDEIVVARADVACRDKHSVTRVWFDAESRLQQAAIEKHAERLDKEKKNLVNAVRNAAGILGTQQQP